MPEKNPDNLPNTAPDNSGNSNSNLPEGRMNCYVCRRCSHTWTAPEPPELCPNCRSCRWMQGRTDRIFCPYCARMWYPEGKDEVCPKCGMSPSLKGKERLACTRCEYIWVKTGEDVPERCPLCHTISWVPESAFTHICSMCGHIWRNRVREPLRCPSCYSEIWNVPCHRLQCKRCGHRWVSRSASQGAASICPKCKSKFWRDPLPLLTCTVCGRPFTAARGNPERCGACSGRKASFDHVCALCGTAWTSEKKYCSCPKCGNTIERPDVKSDSVIWKKDDMSLMLETENGSSTIYLLEDGRPLTAVYLPDALNLLGKNQKGFLEDTSEREMEWLALTMHLRRNDYRKKVGYLRELLGLEEGDAVILAMHFDSMSPESIALRLGVPPNDISEAFGRIMDAYRRTGITVNDSVYTADPFAEYRKQID